MNSLPLSATSIQRIDARTPGFREELDRVRAKLSPAGNIVSPKGRELTLRVFGEPLTPAEVVQRICESVKTRGIAAVVEYSKQLDGAHLDPDRLRLPEDMLVQAHRSATAEFLSTVRQVRDNVLTFQRAILHRDVECEPSVGVRLSQRYVPLHRIGVCVPGGAAAYPSTVLMTVVPAQAAGVEQIAIVAPPTKFGAYNPDVLATCYELGVREVYPIGGAQAVAALAYGVAGLLPVDKIVGPGNLFVALAKKLLYGNVDIDSIAGPSEVVVIADTTTSARYVAADMLAQAEHSPGASLLVTWDESLVYRVEQAIQEQVTLLSRHELTVESLNAFGAFIIVRDPDQACEITNLLAPEHLHIACEGPRKLLSRIRNAGATFLGPFSPVAIGDYAAGPSHVLPTGGTARWAAGLSANSFLRAGSVIEYSESALREIAPYAMQLATVEGLTAHRKSIEIRLQ